MSRFIILSLQNKLLIISLALLGFSRTTATQVLLLLL